jgi:hypothetical protein
MPVVELSDIREKLGCFGDRQGFDILLATMLSQQQDPNSNPNFANMLLLGEIIGFENAVIASLVLNGMSQSQSTTGTSVPAQNNMLPLLLLFLGPERRGRFPRDRDRFYEKREEVVEEERIKKRSS